MIVVWLFFKVPRVCLQFVIVLEIVVFLIIFASIASSFQQCESLESAGVSGQAWLLIVLIPIFAFFFKVHFLAFSVSIGSLYVLIKG